jgi:cytochrome P450
MEKAGLYSLLVPWLGTGLLTAGGAKWKARRRLLTPAFHFDILRGFAAIMNERTDVCLRVLADRARAGAAFDVAPVLTSLTLGMPLRCPLHASRA